MKSPVPKLVPSTPNFAGRLQEGERLLWEGRPDSARYNRARIIPLSLILLPFMPVFVWAIGAKFGANLPFLSPLTFLIALGLWPLACFGIAGYVGQQTPWIAYALTDRRIFIRRLQRQTSQDTRPKIEEYPLQTLQPRLRLRGGSGTITFGFPITEYEHAFREIPDASAVFVLLTEALAARVPSSGDTPYYLKKSVPLVPAVGLEAYLQREEILLWEGEMDTAAYWHGQRIAIVALHLLIPAALGTYLEATGQWTPLLQIAAFIPTLFLYPLCKAAIIRSSAGRKYALTNKRVLFLKKSGKYSTLEEREIWETRAMRLIRGKAGFGTIIFEKKTHVVSHGQGASVETYELSFKHIPDAESVFAQIAEAARLPRPNTLIG